MIISKKRKRNILFSNSFKIWNDCYQNLNTDTPIVNFHQHKMKGYCSFGGGKCGVSNVAKLACLEGGWPPPPPVQIYKQRKRGGRGRDKPANNKVHPVSKKVQTIMFIKPELHSWNTEAGRTCSTLQEQTDAKRQGLLDLFPSSMYQIQVLVIEQVGSGSCH
jgi:hypothetical protein